MNEHVLAAPVPSDNAVGLSALNHFTIPVSSTSVSEVGLLDAAAR
jgi:hypothetical protein